MKNAIFLGVIIVIGLMIFGAVIFSKPEVSNTPDITVNMPAINIPPEVVVNTSDPTVGAGWYPSADEISGNTSANMCLLPSEAVFADSTTTDPSRNQGGCVIDQVVTTQGKDITLLNIQAIGNATSTLYVRQMGSQNGTDYFDVGTSTAYLDNGMRQSTTTLLTFGPTGFQQVPGVSTTTISIPFVTTGYQYTRFIVYGDDLITDATDGVYAWITAIKVDPVR